MMPRTEPKIVAKAVAPRKRTTAATVAMVVLQVIASPKNRGCAGVAPISVQSTNFQRQTQLRLERNKSQAWRSFSRRAEREWIGSGIRQRCGKRGSSE